MDKKNGGFQEWQMNKWGGCASFRNQHRNSLKHSATVGDEKQTDGFFRNVYYHAQEGHQKGFRLEFFLYIR